MDVTRRDLVELGLAAVLVGVAAGVHFAGATPVLSFLVAALAIAVLARLVGSATEQLGSRLGSSVAGAVQSALGNLLFRAALAEARMPIPRAGLHQGRAIERSGDYFGASVNLAARVAGQAHGGQVLATDVVAAAARGHGVNVVDLGAFELRNISQPVELFELEVCPAAAGNAVDPVCRMQVGRAEAAGRLRQHDRDYWFCSLGCAAAFASDWFVSALKPATHSLGMSQAFAGLVVVAIAGNAVENVVGVQLAARNRPDFAISVIVNSALQVALLLTPLLVFASLFFAATLTLVFPTLLAIALLLAAWIMGVVVYDGESTWEEGAILVGLYVVVGASFWWGA